MADASTKVVTSTQITHIGSGTSLAAAALSPSSDVSVALAGTGNLARYPMCDVALFVAPTASVASTSTNIYLYRRDINIDGTNDETVPDASNKIHFMGAFVLKGGATTASTTHYVQLTDIPLPSPGDCEFYIENGLGVNIPAGWTLKVTPKTWYGATS